MVMLIFYNIIMLIIDLIKNPLIFVFAQKIGKTTF